VPSLRSTLGQIHRRALRARERVALRSGEIARAQPLCPYFGYSRGTPIDRFYIEQFLAANAGNIKGRVLEIGDDSYSKRFGGERISTQDVLDVRPEHDRATIIGDLSQPGILPEHAFDCIILTQTLHLIFDLERAVAQLHRALRPQGVLLLTAPGVSSIDRSEWASSWLWSFTAPSLTRVLSGPFDPKRVDCTVFGNLFAASAFLHGAAVEDVRSASLIPNDPCYPVIVAARAVA